MKKILNLAVFVFLFFFGAYGQTNSGNTAEATLNYLNALAEKDKAALINLSCKSWEEQASLEADALLSVGAALSNVNCQATGEIEENLQIVRCTGSLDLTYGEEIRAIDLSLSSYSMSLEDGQWRVCSYH